MENQFVFIVGLPRTGSTLLRTQLNRSRRVCIAAETHFLSRWARVGHKKRILRYGDLNDDRNLDRLLDQFFSPKHKDHTDFWAWLNRNFSREEFRSRICATDRSDQAFFELLITIYTEKMSGEVCPDLILGEKTSANIYYIPTLLEWYPNAKFIHTFRDPRGIFVSALKLVKAGKWTIKPTLPPLPRPLLSPTQEIILAGYISKLWLDASRLHAIYARRYADRYILLKFEDVLADPETHLRRVCDFMGIPFEPVMVEDVIVIGSSYSQQRLGSTGFDAVAVDRWKDHIHPLTKAWLTRIGKRQLENFGYLP